MKRNRFPVGIAVLAVCLCGALTPLLGLCIHRANAADEKTSKIVKSPNAETIAGYLRGDKKNEVSIDNAEKFKVVTLKRGKDIFRMFCFPELLRIECRLIEPRVSASVTYKMINEWNKSNVSLGSVHLDDDGDAIMTLCVITQEGITEETMLFYVALAVNLSDKFIKEFSK